MFLITGAGGGVGSVSRRVVAELRAADEPVRAMVRRDDVRADGLRDLGAEVVVGDLTSPLDGANAVGHHGPAGTQRRAVRAGTSRPVLLTFLAAVMY